VAELVTPRVGLRASFLAALLEYHEDGMHLELDIPGETRRFTEPGYLEQPLVSASSAFVPARPPSEPSFGN